MTGITDYGFYVPRFRLERAEIAKAWGTAQPPGERAVANYDEDALTLGTEAALSCLAGAPGAPEGLLFASTSAPYSEKQVASMIATACDLPRAVWTADFAGSARAGLSAMLAAWHAVAAGSRADVLVTAADVRLGEPNGELEGWIGDGAAAVQVGRERVLAEFVDQASMSEEFTHFWRLDDSRFVQVSSGRFSDTYGYVRDLAEVVKMLLSRQSIEPEQITCLALAPPGARAAADVAKQLGFDPRRQVITPPYAAMGSAGVADPLFAVVVALQSASPGDLIVAGAYGEGADAVLLRVTDSARGRADQKSLSKHLDQKAILPSYSQYLKYRRLVPVEDPGEPVPNVLEHKELQQDVRLYGSRCAACGTVQYPLARVCIRCQARDQLAPHKLGRQGQVFTFTVDHLVANIEHPLPMLVVDLDGGGRIYVQGTDMAAEDVGIGVPVVLTFRRLHDGGGNHNYYWKARPPR